MALLQNVARTLLKSDIADMQESIRQRDDSLELLTERLAELELSLEDIGWRHLGQETQREFSRDALRKINVLARLYWIKNPLLKRAVAVQTVYVFGQGVNIQAKHPKVNKVIQAFLDDPKNQTELTSHQARMTKETELQVFANVFFVFFVNVSRGTVRIRTIPVDEVDEVICNPEDAKDPWYYRRTWTEQRLDENSGQYITTTKTAYYPDWRHRPTRKPGTIGQHPVHWDRPVYHVAVNKLSDMKLGVSEIYAAIDWARAYKEFLENWATIVKAYSRFAWNLTTKGGAKGVAAAKSTLKSTLTSTGTTENNPPPVTASTFIGTEGTKMEPVRTAGATTKAEDGRRLLLMVSAATGIFEHYFGDPSTGNLATAKSMERPMELMFRDRQQLWADVHHDIMQFVIDQAAKAVNGPLEGTVAKNDYDEEIVVLAADPETGEPMDRHIDVTFPDILEKDVEAKINAIIKAGTLDGKSTAGTIDLPTITRLLLGALGVEQIDELMDKLFPDGEEGEDGGPMFRREELAPEPPPIPGQAPGQPPGQPPGGRVDPEEMFAEAMRELREAVMQIGAGSGAVGGP